MIGRYERGDAIPSIEGAKKIADVLEVSADALLDDEKVLIKDKALFKKFETIQEMSGESKEMIERFLDMAVRDFKAKQAYS